MNKRMEFKRVIGPVVGKKKIYVIYIYIF